MGRWRDLDAHTHRLEHHKAAMETGRYEPVKAEADRGHGGRTVGLAAMETDRYGPVKGRAASSSPLGSSQPQWRPTATGGEGVLGEPGTVAPVTPQWKPTATGR